MRIGLYCDYSYRVDGGALSAELPVSLFLAGLSEHCERLVMAGRLDPRPGRYPYAVRGAEFVALPYYASGARLGGVLRTTVPAVVRFWRMLASVDVVWVLGPTPLAVVFALLTLVRRRRLVLGVRQDTVKLFRHRYPDRRLLRWGSAALELVFRALTLRVPVVVVGPVLARHYRHARTVHTAYVTQLRDADIADRDGDRRAYDGDELRMLSVGRLDPEKNPLLLPEVLAAARRIDPRWRLDVCGAGPLSHALARRLEELGVADRATLHGHVPNDGGLGDLYRSSHALIHVSLTEGVPAVLLEAFAARLPIVATAVGGVPDLVRGCGLLIPPRDAPAAADALRRLVATPDLRAELTERGADRARGLTRRSECARVAEFIAAAGGPRAPAGRRRTATARVP